MVPNPPAAREAGRLPDAAVVLIGAGSVVRLEMDCSVSRHCLIANLDQWKAVSAQFVHTLVHKVIKGRVSAYTTLLDWA